MPFASRLVDWPSRRYPSFNKTSILLGSLLIARQLILCFLCSRYPPFFPFSGGLNENFREESRRFVEKKFLYLLYSFFSYKNA